MEKRVKTNPIQWSLFLDFAEKHPEILTKKFNSIASKQKYNEMWKEISSQLKQHGISAKNGGEMAKGKLQSITHYTLL